MTIDDFHKIEMKIGTILVAEFIEGADKLLRLEVDFGPKEIVADREEGEGTPRTPLGVTEEGGVVLENGNPRDIRQILSGIREYYQPEQLIGKQFPFVTNLAPRIMRGLTSHGMILAAKTPEGNAVLLNPDKEVPPGSLLS